MTSVPVPDASAVKVGGNFLYGVPFPIVIGDHYIHLRMDGPELVCQVWRWDAGTRTAIREPDPGDAGAGIALDSMHSGGFAVRLAPDVGGGGFTGSASLGKLRVVAEADGITVFREDDVVMQMMGNKISGFEVGIKVDDEGMGIGSHLPDGFTYQIDYVQRRIRLPNLVPGPEQPVIANVRFSHCRIEGPAVIAGRGLTIHRCGWNMLGAPEECVQIDLPNPHYAYGAIVLENVGIFDSEIVNIALVTPPA